MWTIDFETHKIVQGSNISPVPVGVSIKRGYEPSEYYAWGHPTNNNCKKFKAETYLNTIINYTDDLIICHNSKYDLRVCLEHFGIALPDPARIVDTMIMAYLVDPREASLGLKQLAEKYCGMPPDDQRELKDWILRNVHGAKPANWGEFICKAPGDLVGKYAESDTDMTFTLYNYLKPLFDDSYMAEAFQREMRILPIVIDLEMRGINLTPDIQYTHKQLKTKFELLDLQLRAYSSGAEPGSKAMFNNLRKKGLIDESKIQYTEKGNPRYGKDFIEDMIADKELVNILKLRSKLQKMVGTYIRPFAESADKYNGKFYPYYNQTRSEDDYGTRTGRFSSNIQQLPKDSGSNSMLLESDVDTKELPSVRTMIVPSKGKVLIKRDFSGQELRVTAHYAEGSILAAYQADPRLDVHEFVGGLIVEKTGMHLQRTPIKTISFLKLYGGGPAKLSERLKIPLHEAKSFFAAYDKALPEFKGLMKDIEDLSRSGKKIRTWGGRSYDVEPAKHDAKTGRRLEYYYKLGNILIQGSSADMTKEAMIRYHYHPYRKGDIVMTVHDEIVVEVDVDDAPAEMELLRWAMDEIPGWDVPLRSDGAIGFNLGEMVKCDE
jgi:DNA polymerase-1